MYSKMRTLSGNLSLTQTSMALPRDAVMDAIILRLSLTISNTSGAPFVSTGLGVLRALQEVRVISDGSTVHYALNGQDISILNGFDGLYGATAVHNNAVNIADGVPGTVTYTLILNEGDILAATKDSLELKVVFSPTLAANVAVTAATMTVSIAENVYTPEEFVAKYGANLELAAEPKVYALSAPVVANTELSGVLDIPTGTLHRRAILAFTDANGVHGLANPQNIGLIITSPDRRELMNTDFATYLDVQHYKFCVNGAGPLGCAVFNYATDMACDGYGLRGWRWSKGDYQVAVRTNAAGVLRYISCEHVVNARIFEAMEHAVLEGTEGI